MKPIKPLPVRELPQGDHALLRFWTAQLSAHSRYYGKDSPGAVRARSRVAVITKRIKARGGK